MKTIYSKLAGYLALALMTASPLAIADAEIEAAAILFAKKSVSRWLSDPVVLTAVRKQNVEHSSLGNAEIDAMDRQWRIESRRADGPLVNKVSGNVLSAFLRSKKNAEAGLVTEIVVMDNKGLNVGQSDITPDFWQGDEAKWQKTFKQAPNTLFIGDVEMVDSTQRFQTQISIAITDPDTGKNIGAVTIGVDADTLLSQEYD